MNHKRLRFYYFGDIGLYNEYSPEYIYTKEFVPEILYIISNNNPFTVSKEKIIKILDIKDDYFDKIISLMKSSNIIIEKNNTFKINFPVFLENDLSVIDTYLNNCGETLGNIIIKNKNLIYEKIEKLSNLSKFSKERLLYHIICDNIFDGTAIDFLGEKNVFSISKKQPDNRDYLIIAYEDNKSVESSSNKLLCSSNNFRSYNFTFNSFGDANGIRKDFYRFFRLTQSTLEKSTQFKEANLSYIKLINDKNKEIAEACGELLIKLSNNELKLNNLSNEEKNLLDLLSTLEYVNVDKTSNSFKIIVPIFTKADKNIINEISAIILTELISPLNSIFNEFETNAKELTSITHNVDIKEIGNELWHQIFGLTNEYLVKSGFVLTPPNINNEGRYLRSFYLYTD